VGAVAAWDRGPGGGDDVTRPWWIRIFRLARPPAQSLAGVVTLIVLAAAVDSLKPWPLKWLVDNILRHPTTPSATISLQRLPGAASTSGQIAYLAAATLAIFIVGQLMRMAQNYLQSGLGSRSTYALGARVFDHLQSLSLLFHTRRPTGDLVRRIITDSGCVRDLLLSVLVPVATSASSLAIMIVVMWRLDRSLAIIAMLVALPLGLLVKLLYGPMSRRADEQEAAQSNVMVQAERTLGAIAVTQIFRRESANDVAFRGACDRSVRAYLATIIAQLQFKIGTGAITALGTAAVMFVGGMHVLNGTLTLGGLLVFLSYLTSLYAPMEALAYVSTALASAGAAGRRVLEVLDSQERVHDRPHALTLHHPPAGHALPIKFDGVTFGYEPGAAVLREVNLTIPAGKTLALVGATGAGKSTMASLVPRLVDPWQGTVFIDGRDIADYTLKSLRDHVSAVPQEPLLLPLSIRENIAYGRPGASIAQIEAAAEAAQAAEFIRRLPRGYDTVLGERGSTLSAGQRQRLAIARALLRDTPVLVLDEPTSALDVGSEALVVQALHRLTRGRTCIVIAHRLSTVKDADLVAVLEAGRVVELGAPAALLAADGAFARFHKLQCGVAEMSPPAAASTPGVMV
jgi:ATP-binding cassette subfamily B protein